MNDPNTNIPVSVATKELEQYAVDTSTLASKPYTGQEVKYHCLKNELGESSQAMVSVAEIMGNFDRQAMERAMPGSKLPGLGDVFRSHVCPDELESLPEPDDTQGQFSFSPSVLQQRELTSDSPG